MSTPICQTCGFAVTAPSADRCPRCGRPPAQPLPCPVCGQAVYTFGNVQGHYPLKFKAADVGFWERVTVFGGEKVRARCCNQCGHIHLFVT